MLAAVVTIFVTSVLGSLHCAGMCGAFVAVAMGDSASRLKTQVAYHGGRLVTYAVLGAAAGALGGVVDLGSALAGFRPVAAALAGGTMVVFGVVSLMKWWGRDVGLRPPGWMGALAGRGYGVAMRYGPVTRAGMIGLMTTLLPCGWLYVFVAAAAGTASVWQGAVSMAAFWVGTLPVMVAVGGGVRAMTGAMRGRVQVAACAVMVVAGLWTVFGRTQMGGVVLTGAESGTPACCKEKE